MLAEEKLLYYVRECQGRKMGGLLCAAWMQGDGALAKAFAFNDAHGAGTWWGNKFDFEGQKARAKAYEGKAFAMEVQARGQHNGLVIMGLTGGAKLGRE